MSIPLKHKRRLSKRQDLEIMQDLEGGRVQPASGALPGYKSDVKVTGKHRIETKWTIAASFRLTREMLNKIRGECRGLERPAVVIDFKSKTSGRTEDRWVCIPYSDWKRYANEATDDS